MKGDLASIITPKRGHCGLLTSAHYTAAIYSGVVVNFVSEIHACFSFKCVKSLNVKYVIIMHVTKVSCELFKLML